MGNETAKYISDGIKETAPDSQKFLNSTETKRAYILKFADKENGGYTYNFVPKKQKVKECHISVLYLTDKDLSGGALNKTADNMLNEVESYIK